MGVGFGGNSVYNGASPSSDRDCVARIVADHVAPFAARPARLLDIGGTKSGFLRQAELPAGATLVIANPEPGVGADYDYVSNIPGSDPGFDFAMLFGVMMYLERDKLVGLFRDVRQRLRAGGALMVAEPDPEGVVGSVEVMAKKIYAAVVSNWDPRRFIFHTAAETRAMLQEAGFVALRDRPELRPMYPGGLLPRMPPYFIIVATV